MSVKFDWSPITTYKSGRALPSGALTGYELDMQVDGAPDFTNLLKPAPGDTTATVDGIDATPGTYHFRLRGMLGSVGGDYATASLVVPDTSGLAAPTTFTVTLV